jgi:serine/threonine-protein kinase
MDVSGMVLVTLDMQGRLLHLETVPPQQDDPGSRTPPADWSSLFAAGGLQESNYRRVQPEWTPLAWGDTRAAWLGSLAPNLDIPERVEAAASHGKPIYFDVIYPWTKAGRSVPFSQTPREKISTAILLILFVALILSGIFVMRRNLRLRRTDTQGALRLGTAVILTFLFMWLISAHHVASVDEFDPILIALAWALLGTSLINVLYLALEPYVRRHEPHTLISWSRLLAGQWRDPLVGRDLLIGATYGVLLTVFEQSDNFLLPLFGKLPPAPGGLDPHTLLGVRPALGALLFYILVFLLYSLLVFFLLFLLGLAVRRHWIAALILVLLAASANSGGEYPVFTFIFFVLIWSSIVLVLKKFGLLAIIVGLVVQNILAVFPTTSHFTRWYANAGLAGIVLIAFASAYGFYTALAGQPLFTGAALDK